MVLKALISLLQDEFVKNALRSDFIKSLID